MGMSLMHSAWLSGALILAPEVLTNPEITTAPLDHLHQDLQDVACNSEYLIFGDTYHPDPSIMNFMAETVTLESIVGCGITKLFIEIVPKFQVEIDALASGALSIEDFITETKMKLQVDLSVLAELVASAGRAGIDVIASDVLNAHYDEGWLRDQNINLKFAYADVILEAGYEELASKVFMNAWLIMPLSEEDMLDMGEIIEGQEGSPAYQRAKKIASKIQRMEAKAIKRTDDAMLADFVNANKGAGERVAILIGNGHPSDREVGIDVRLNPEMTSWIALKGENPIQGEGQPDRIYDLLSRKVIIPSLIPVIP
jgi:hypothetical protein